MTTVPVRGNGHALGQVLHPASDGLHHGRMG
jgi:hypothetical protein